MEDFGYQIKIPKERIAVLIGKNGEIKTKLEEATKTKINVDSNEGDVTVSGEDALLLYTTRDIIKAIGRGFNPEISLLLLKQDYSFELINLPDFDNSDQMRRIKGRVIGKEGKSRKLIEEYTESFISVYGKTIGIIGRVDTVHIARRAVEMLVMGSQHAAVYKWLEKKRFELGRREHEENINDYMKPQKEEEKENEERKSS